MTSKLYNAVQCAIKTFKRVTRGNVSISDEFLKPLQTLVDEIQFCDVHLPARLFSNSDQSEASSNQVEYFSVYEDEIVTVGVFIIRSGAKIPLHDHPDMTGIIKVLHGKLEINSYDVINFNLDPSNDSDSNYYTKPLTARKNPPLILSASDKCSLLTPIKSNIHEVKCINGPAAFLDVLSPPYDSDSGDKVPRSCHYFKEILSSTSSLNNVVQLVQVPCPGYV